MALAENIFERTESMIGLFHKPNPTLSRLLREHRVDCMGAESDVIIFGVIMIMVEAASEGQLGDTLERFLNAVACHQSWT
jgi:ABC-type dipeptide/oligopeptide/nickel transport system permease subunit